MDRVKFKHEQEERARIEQENLEKEYEKQLCIKMARLRKEQRERDIKEQEEYIKSFEHQEYIRQIRKKQDKYLEKEHLELVDRVEKERIEFKKKYIDIFNPSDKSKELILRSNAFINKVTLRQDNHIKELILRSYVLINKVDNILNKNENL